MASEPAVAAARRAGPLAVSVSVALAACGGIATLAVQRGIWGLLTGTLLVGIWLAAISWRGATRPRPVIERTVMRGADAGQHLLLDAVATPMLAIEGQAVRALNRAARRLFATDDCLSSPPAALIDRSAAHLTHEGRRWRIDRVVLGDGRRMVAALIDIEREERAAEARATAEMIHVLGHELLNGLAPIASLAESGLAAIERRDPDPALLREVLGTLARRAEGLQRFTEAYRSLARLPEPQRRSTSVDAILDDLARLFAGRWPDVALIVDVEPGTVATIDRDQLGQALWALLQNAAEAGAGTVRVTATRPGTTLAIEVADDGPGIDPTEAARVFRPFHTTKAEGTGVGLSLARQIAHGHGGTLMLQPGAGARFRLSLPV